MRPNWDEYFMEIAQVVAKRSTCLRHNIGSVVVKDKRILTTGYNGAPTGLAHCLDSGCIRDELEIESGTKQEICMALHAEMNAIVQAAKNGISLDGATLYCTHQPCSMCARMIVNAGIKRVVFAEGYPDDFALHFLEGAKVKVDEYIR